ncbi:uncharacterized protein KNAG_0C01980 [Huiozyma naganishii CBS 8797]|uniref:Peptide hydrolase n=1 Tax=Huiozyma naganishii (strain ATCC MYA-139 / BCRC 22969 / CBS 8797 / KCTC 17520 / NBRC 10181 / NCYC 3082 / Yp74L-3) TaxID=1071383 RepID=J7S5Q4_HUIN7|nr:hypothetical protein KNAG_0C01980 [Kazachstania naganishii CBS 8797]CCK69311.1 hypothetical protein KNAG_0C01980 [Kazachstania naganishii CBS 8797]
MLLFLHVVLTIFICVCGYDIDDYNLQYYSETLPSKLSLTNDSKHNLLLPFNTTRLPSSNESLEIREFIKSHFANNLDSEWIVEEDTHFENGLNFTNLIFTWNPTAASFIVLAAHYDTKFEPAGFIGAMDSAASCAIMMYAAEFMDEAFQHDSLLINHNMGLKIVFFDGEEAVKDWTPEDSLYGARHLAESWEKNKLLPRIEILILMDLIGGKTQVKIPSYYRQGHPYYQLLDSIEDAYLTTEFAEETSHHKELDVEDIAYLLINQVLIEDDHVPFYKKGVAPLHLIPTPFPPQWHTIDDDFDHLDQGEVNKWAVMMCECLHELFALPANVT